MRGWERGRAGVGPSRGTRKPRLAGGAGAVASRQRDYRIRRRVVAPPGRVRSRLSVSVVPAHRSPCRAQWTPSARRRCRFAGLADRADGVVDPVLGVVDPVAWGRGPRAWGRGPPLRGVVDPVAWDRGPRAWSRGPRAWGRVPRVWGHGPPLCGVADPAPGAAHPVSGVADPVLGVMDPVVAAHRGPRDAPRPCRQRRRLPEAGFPGIVRHSIRRRTFA